MVSYYPHHVLRLLITPVPDSLGSKLLPYLTVFSLLTTYNFWLPSL